MSGRLVLHIGTEKTASTHIQRVLAANRRTLRRAGVHYPYAFREASWGHHNLTWWVKGRRRRFRKPTPWTLVPPAWTWRQLGRRRGVVVLSSETMCHLRAEEWRRLLDDTSAVPEIVLFLRRRDDMVPSLWRERTKERPVDDVVSWMADLASRRRSPIRYLDLVRMLTELERDGLVADVRLVSYDRLVQCNDDPAEVLARRILGIDATLEAPPGPANPGLDDGVAEVLRRLQVLDAAHRRPLGARRLVGRARRRPLAATADHLVVVGRHTVELDRRFAAEDAELVSEHGHRFLDPVGDDGPFGRADAPTTVPVHDPGAGQDAVVALYGALRRR